MKMKWIRKETKKMEHGNEKKKKNLGKKRKVRLTEYERKGDAESRKKRIYIDALRPVKEKKRVKLRDSGKVRKKM